MLITKDVCVKIKIEVPDDYQDPLGELDAEAAIEEAAESAINECPYDFPYEDEETGVKIVDTEILGMQDHPAIGL
jgi:hypothetical protein